MDLGEVEMNNKVNILLKKQSVRRLQTDPNHVVKQAIWIYFLLVLFEGALRKWFLPALATPLLIVRDPVALYILVTASKRNMLPGNAYVNSIIVIGIVGTLTAVIVGHGNIAVALFGARILFFHFPVMFVIGRVFTREDVIKMGKVLLWISIPMTALIALQFYSPQGSWVNAGIGGDLAGTAAKSGLAGGLGYFRPPGTFSFATGTGSFYSLAAPFILYFCFHPSTVKRNLLIASTICLVAAIPLSISRGLFFQVALSVLFLGLSIIRKPIYVGRMIGAVIGIAIALLILNNTSIFNTATAAFTDRFTSASEAEGGLQGTLGDRYLVGLISAVSSSFDLPFFGYGIGMGTNVGAQMLTGNTTFLIAEGEWGRVIGELGFVLGFAVIIIRLSLGAKVTVASYQRLVAGDSLPWMLLSTGLLLITQGGWAQPTSLGFCTITGGLLLASFNIPNTFVNNAGKNYLKKVVKRRLMRIQ